MKHWLLIALFVTTLTLSTILQAQQTEDEQSTNQTVYELQVRNLPPGGRAWSAIQPVQDLPDVSVQNINMDASRVIIRVSGELDRRALEQALEGANLLLVYITERDS